MDFNWMEPILFCGLVASAVAGVAVHRVGELERLLADERRRREAAERDFVAIVAGPRSEPRAPALTPRTDAPPQDHPYRAAAPGAPCPACGSSRPRAAGSCGKVTLRGGADDGWNGPVGELTIMAERSSADPRVDKP